MKNKGFINPQLGLFILAGLLVVGGGAMAYRTLQHSPSNVLGEATALPPGVPQIKYTQIKVMQTIRNESFAKSGSGFLPKGYVFTAVPGQVLELGFKEVGAFNSDALTTSLYDKNGRLLRTAQSVMDIYAANGGNYSGKYYLVVKNKGTLAGPVDVYLEDAMRARPILSIRDSETNIVHAITKSQMIDPNYTVAVKKGVLIIDFNKHIGDALKASSSDLEVCTLAGTKQEHIPSTPNGSAWRLAENDGFCSKVKGVLVNSDTVWFFSDFAQGLYQSIPPYYSPITLPELSQVSIYGVEGYDSYGEPYLRFWTR